MKYKVGDRVKIKSLDWYNRYTNGTEVNCKHYPFSCHMKKYCGQIMTISIAGGHSYGMIEDDGAYSWTDEMIEGLAEEETVHNKWTGLKVELELSKTVIGVSNVESVNGERFMSGFVKAIIPPEGYIFKDENGNVINAKKIVLEKKQNAYPKTYEGCCEVLSLGEDGKLYTKGYKASLIQNFQKLIICRDAYWKIAGEEMGLGKPWEPEGENTFGIFYDRLTDETEEQNGYHGANSTLEFPTPEMRDAFKENFDPDIEICKELL